MLHPVYPSGGSTPPASTIFCAETAQVAARVAFTAPRGPILAREGTPAGGPSRAISCCRVTRERDTAAGLSVGRMAAVVPAGLALVWGLPALLELGGQLAERMPRSAALSLAALLIVGMAGVWCAVLRGEVR